MKKEDYKRLNDYLNDTFIYLSGHDRFFIQNMRSIFIFNNMLYGKLKDIELEHKFHENNLTFEDVYELARNEIEKINSNYLKEFDKLIDSGRLEFFLHEQNMIIKESTYYENLSEIENNEEEIRNDSVCSYNNGDYFIDLARTYNYDDVLMLIHEFIHSTNSSKNMGEYRYILTEFFSIYFEMLSQKDLLENGNKDKVVWLNDHINDEEIKKMNFIDVLKIIGIDLTDENINKKLVDGAQNYYENLSKYSVKKEKEKSLTYNI